MPIYTLPAAAQKTDWADVGKASALQLQNMMQNLILMKAAANIRAKEAQASKDVALAVKGIYPAPEGGERPTTGMVAPGQAPGQKMVIDRPVPPTTRVGGKPYYQQPPQKYDLGGGVQAVQMGGEWKIMKPSVQAQSAGIVQEWNLMKGQIPDLTPEQFYKMKKQGSGAGTALERGYYAYLKRKNLTPDQYSLEQFKNTQWGPETEQPFQMFEYGPDGTMRLVSGTGKPSKAAKILGLPTQKDYSDLRKAESSAKTSIQLMNRMKTQLAENPTILGTVGTGQRVVNSLYRQLQAAGMVFSGDRRLLSPEQYNFDRFTHAATQSAAFRRNAVQLAYIMARAVEPTGRLSDADVKLQLDSLAVGGGSPEQIIAAMDEAQWFVGANYRNDYEALYNKPPDADWLPEHQTGIEKNPQEMTNEELKRAIELMETGGR